MVSALMRWILLGWLGALIGCGASSSSVGGGGNPDSGNGNGQDSGSSSNPGSDAGNTQGSDGGSSGCSAQAKLVYVIDLDNTFSSFQPGNSPTFTDIGTLQCPAFSGATPQSMSVDRNAIAWVLYNDGELFRVDTGSLACTATGFAAGQKGFYTFGMGFVSDTSGGTTDTLYIADNGELGTLDTSTLQVATVGALNGQPELTGTGDARLFGFFPNATTPRVSQLDKSSAVEGTSYPLQPLAGSPNAWAFAFWGGDFWIFLKRTTDSSTNVWHLVADGGTVTEALDSTGREIVGAGVSTCAPTVMPQ
jgi:hypothetical protein